MKQYFFSKKNNACKSSPNCRKITLDKSIAPFGIIASRVNFRSFDR